MRLRYPTVSYSQAVQSHLKVAIVAKGFPVTKLNDEQVKAIEAILEKKIDMVQPGKVIPRFEGCHFKNYAFIVIFLDKVS